MKWYTFPVVFRYKNGKEELDKILSSRYCPELGIRFVAHPEKEGQSIMIDSLGVTDIALPPEKLDEVFSVGRE